MPSTASDLLKVELQATGENNSTWGTKANTVFSRLEEGIADITNISLASLGGVGYTLDDTQYVEHNDGTNTAESHVAAIKATGTMTANEDVVVPSRNKIYWVWNATSGTFTTTVKTAAGSGIVVPQGSLMAVICDGTNVEALSVPVDASGNILLYYNIVDNNGNELVVPTTVASAVNHLGVKNAATGNGPEVEALGDDTNIDLILTPKGTGVVKSGSTAIGLSGKHALPISAAGMYSPTTNGAADGSTETTTNAVQIYTKDFDASTDEYVQFQIPMPPSWNEGTVTAKFYWSHAATTTNFGVAWGIQGLSLGDSDAIDAAWGTGVVVTDTGGTTDDVFVTSETSAVTIAGTPAESDLVIFRVYRDISDAGDTMAIDARLHGITLYVTTVKGNDA